MRDLWVQGSEYNWILTSSSNMDRVLSYLASLSVTKTQADLFLPRYFRNREIGPAIDGIAFYWQYAPPKWIRDLQASVSTSLPSRFLLVLVNTGEVVNHEKLNETGERLVSLCSELGQNPSLSREDITIRIETIHDIWLSAATSTNLESFIAKVMIAIRKMELIKSHY
jgi:hypothetical protein